MIHSGGKPQHQRPTDSEIQEFVKLRTLGKSISHCLRQLGIYRPRPYYDWVERGSSKNEDDHIKFPQSRKFYLAIKDLPQSKRGPKEPKPEVLSPPIQVLPPPDIFAQVPKGVEKELLHKCLDLISTKMADGNRSELFCDYCLQSGIHGVPGRCSCLCHLLRDYFREPQSVSWEADDLAKSLQT